MELRKLYKESDERVVFCVIEEFIMYEIRWINEKNSKIETLWRNTTRPTETQRWIDEIENNLMEIGIRDGETIVRKIGIDDIARMCFAVMGIDGF